MANAEIYILDRFLNLMPVGVPGELYIGGDGLARAYLNQAALTRDRFIPHPFRDAPGARLYRSGDRARYLPDGNIELLGRLDHQVKVRGFRIELGEIESVLEQHATVRAAVAVCREDSAGNKRLLVYVVAHDGHRPIPAELREFLQRLLPEYMLPAKIVVLDRLPVTANGKLDRTALPDGPDDPVAASDAHVAPRTDLEYAIALVWQEVLGVERIGVYDNFFDSGGHSLLLARVHSRLRNVLPGELQMIDLFRHPTIASLAARFEGEARDEDAHLSQIQERVAKHRTRGASLTAGLKRAKETS
jgi:hypothetical protein